MNLRIYASEGNGSAGIERADEAVACAAAGGPDLRMLASADTARASDGVETVQRGVDIMLATAILLFLMPLFVILAAVILFDSRGPVLFKQYRVGKNGEEFWFYKFRSMVADAEVRRVKLASDNEATGPMFKIKSDPRITRSGRWLRKYSLDELPQLINVIKGDMSLVGPRPALPAEVAKYTDHQRGRLAVRPGITGLWQVSGRSDLPFDRCVELDLEYIRCQSVWLYVRILVLTVPAVASGRGAY